MMDTDRLVNAAKLSEEEREADSSLRPETLDAFIGQKKLTDNLKVFIEAARLRAQPLDHVLLAGPPGLGKTTLAYIIAKELGVNIKATSAPIIDKAGDLASILTGLEKNDVLFIDEIHRLAPAIEEILYPAMEDHNIDILVGQGVGAKSIKLALAPFTLVAATTRTGLLTSALRDRFGIPLRLDYYSPEELQIIAERSARIMACRLETDAALEIARRARRTPRIVNRLLKRVADFSIVGKNPVIDLATARFALERLDIDELGLDEMDRKILQMIITNHNGGPVGIKTIAISLGEETDTLEDYYEPFLVQSGLLNRTSRGRVVTPAACKHLGVQPPFEFMQETLFGEEAT